jgi:hypothetical protein
MFNNQLFDVIEFIGRKSVTASQTNRIQSIFCFTIIPFHVDMLRFVTITRVEEESIRTGSKNCRH